MSSERFQDARFFAKQPWVEYVFIFSTLMSQILTQAGANYTLPLLTILSDFFSSSTASQVWYSSSFSLSTGTLILISGRIGDVYGLKRVVLWGYAWTTLWSLLSGLSYYVRNPAFFIVSRAFAGAGTAFLLPNAMGACGRVYRPGTRRKVMIFSLIGLASPVGGCVGPIVAGLIATETKYWNWICYSYTIASTLTMVLTWWSMPQFDRLQSVSVDWIGCFLGVSGLVLFNFVWNQAPVAGGWGTPYIIALLVISIVIMAVFLWYELHFPQNPLLPRAVVRNVRLLLTMLVMLLCWGAWGVGFYRFFVFMLDLRHYSPLGAAASLTPAIVSGSIAALTVGYAIRWIPAHLLLVFAACMFLSTCLILEFMPVHQTYWLSSFWVFASGVWGMDVSFPASTLIMSESMAPEYQALGSSLIVTMVNYGQAFAQGVASTVEQRTLLKHPGDTLAAHKACMWFAIGVSGGAVLVSLCLALAHYLYDKRKAKKANLAATDIESHNYHVSKSSEQTGTMDLVTVDEKHRLAATSPGDILSCKSDENGNKTSSEGAAENTQTSFGCEHKYPRDDIPAEILGGPAGPVLLI